MRRTHLRGHPNILKPQLIHIGAFNLSLIFRSLLGAGTPRELRNRLSSFIFALSWLLKRSPMCTGSINLYSSPPRLHPSRMSRYLRYHFRHSKRRGSADRKSTRLNSSHGSISYAVFCLKKKKKKDKNQQSNPTQ